MSPIWSMLHSLEGFANMELVTFRELTAGFFLGFEHNLWASGCSRNTSACYFRALRAICKEAERQGMLKDAKQLFSEVFMGYEETRKRALSIEQLRMVADADLEDTPSLGVARDLFILSYYLRGIPFIDLAYLRKTDIQDNVLCYRRSKTGRMLTITLEPWMWEIIERYLCDDSGSPYLLRIIRQSGIVFFFIFYVINTSVYIIDLCFFFHMLSISFPETVYNLTYNLLCKLPEGIFTFSFYLRNSSNPVSLIWSTREPSPVLTIFPSTIT